MSETLTSGLAWPAAIALAWLAGELGQRWLSLPRISSYGLAGFFMSAHQGGFLPSPAGGPIQLLADLAFALMLFELGYRINLRWLRSNPWIAATSVFEAGGTFVAVFLVAQAFAVPPMPSLLLAALAMSTSPAAVLRVANELRSAGQVTERLLHLSAANCVLAVLVFKLILAYALVAGAGDLLTATWHSVVQVAVSAGIGVLFGVTVPGLLRSLGHVDRQATFAFAVAVLLLTALTHTLKFSPLLAALAFGLVARHRRLVLSPAQRNFGVLGDLLAVLLFVFVATTLEWQQVLAGLGLGLALVGTRLVTKLTITTLLARVSGISWRKGALTGLAMTPMAVLALLLLEQSRHLEPELVGSLPAIAAIVLLLEVLGPLLTRLALVAAGEARPLEDR
jgi:Kef-type K+ transport system membrane component KefB